MPYYTDIIGGGIGSEPEGYARNDDGFFGPFALGFTLTYFGEEYTEFYINNNGNISFGRGVRAFTPDPIDVTTDAPLIGPYWGDVDTRGGDNGTVTLRNDIENQIIVTWDQVGYFPQRTDRLASFQLVLRGPEFPIPAGEGTIGFFYNDIEWETGGASGGIDGFGGVPATAGFGDGLPEINPGEISLPGSQEDGISERLSNEFFWFNLGDEGIPTEDPLEPILRFSPSNLFVSEPTGRARVTVVRSGDRTPEVGATITLTDGTATAPDDYDNSPITVNFASDQTTQTVEIPLVEDGLLEGPETVNLQLTEPTGGALLGLGSIGSLRIIDESIESISGYVWNDEDSNGVRNTRVIEVEAPDVVLAIDISDSTTADGSSDSISVGDINADGIANTILDLELAGFQGLNQNLISEGFGSSADLSIVVFVDKVEQLDMDPSTPGFQGSTTPAADNDGNGVPDVEEILAEIATGTIAGAGTEVDYEAALEQTIEIFSDLGTDAGDGNIIFLSNSTPAVADNIEDPEAQFNDAADVYRDEVRTLTGNQVNLRAFGASESAGLEFLQTLDSDARVFADPSELLTTFSGLEVGKTVLTEATKSGVTIYIDENNNRNFDPGELATVTQVDDPGTSEDEMGTYQFRDLPPGNYTVRQLVPAGFVETGPSDGLFQVSLEQLETVTGINFGLIAGRVSVPGSPRARRDSAASLRNRSVAIDVLANDIDPEGDNVQLASFTTPNNGTVRLLDNGTPEDLTDDRLIYTPNSGFVGNDRFAYTISDFDGNTDSDIVQVRVISRTPTLTQTLTSTPTPKSDPACSNDRVTIAENTAITINVLANDNDPDGDIIQLVDFGNASNGTVRLENNGTPADQSDDQLVYTPESGFTGNDSFTYSISDENGGMDAAIVEVTVMETPTPIPTPTNPGLIRGTNRRDNLMGTEGDDTILGLGEDDILRGNAGDDLLSGDEGKDILRGGGGSDTFILRTGTAASSNSAADLIVDFQVGVDAIGLTSGITLSDLTLEEVSGNTIIKITQSDLILGRLGNVTPEGLNENFVSVDIPGLI